MSVNVVRLALVSSLLFGCGDDSTSVDAGRPDVPAPDVPGQDVRPCTPQTRLTPIWMAGQAGSRSDVGAFGKPDAIFILGDHLIAGDEDPAYEELHVYDLNSDDPAVDADQLTPLADLGAQPGPGGSGPAEFRAISGFAALASGVLYVAEQGNDRLQMLQAIPTAPFYESVGFLGAPAVDRDMPGPAEFVRLQALRVDSMDRLFVSDDGRDGTDVGRRDIQVFDNENNFLFRFGMGEAGDAFGQNGNVQEPENFAIDEARDRIYVCDEGPNNVVVYRYSDQSFVRRFGDGIFTGTTNGVDFDEQGRIYVVDEGNALSSGVRVFDPDTFEELAFFGELSAADDFTPGTFNSPDTLLIDRDRDLLIIADQGHDRIQGFRLSDAQRAACL